MAKKVMAQVKLQVMAGKANPSPPIGPALGQHGVNIMDFCKAFNARTSNQEEMIVPGTQFEAAAPAELGLPGEAATTPATTGDATTEE